MVFGGNLIAVSVSYPARSRGNRGQPARYRRDLIDTLKRQDPLHLSEQALHEPEVAPRYQDHRRLCLDQVDLSGVEADLKVRRVGCEQQAHFGLGERLELMDEANT